MTLPSNLEYIGNDAFFSNAITTINIPKTVTILGQEYITDGNPFGYCPITSITVEDGNPRYEALDGGKVLWDKKYYGILAAFGNAAIPADTKIIGSNAYCNNGAITTITVPEGVKRIGGNAFSQCSNLTSVTLPESLEEIGYSCFTECPNLTTINIPAGVTTLHYNTFGQTAITEITIPKNVTSIDGQLFMSCNQLTSVTSLIKNPNDVNEYAFQLSSPWSDDPKTYLPKLYVPTGTKALYEAKTGWNKFQSIEEKDLPDEPIVGDILTYTSDEGTLKFTISSVKDKTCKLARIKKYNEELGTWSEESPYEGSSKTITIPATVDGYAVTEIAERAFEGLDNVTSIELPNSIKTIGAGAFFWMNELSRIVSNNENPTDVDAEAFIKNGNIHWIDGTVTYSNQNYYSVLIIPVGTKAAYKSKTGWNKFTNYFSGNEGQNFTVKTTEDVDVLYTVLSDEDKTCQVGYVDANREKKAIEQSGDQTAITIPACVTFNDVSYKVIAIGSYAFADCYRVTSVNLPDGLTSIGEYAFNNCYQIPSIELPGTISSIGKFAFFNLDRLSGFKSNILEPTAIDEEAFVKAGDDWDSDTQTYKIKVYHDNLFVPAGKKDVYKSTAGWNKFTNYYSGNEGSSFTAKTTEDVDVVYTILDEDNKICQVGYLDGNYNKTAIEKDGVQTAITIPATVTYNDVSYQVTAIGKWAFNNCYRISKITIPEGLTTIGEYAFANNYGLSASIEIPSTVTSIGNDAFRGLGNMTSVISRIESPFDVNEEMFQFYKWNSETEQDEEAYLETLYVPLGTKAAYEGKTGWNKIGTIKELNPNNIIFADDKVKKICIAAGWDTDGDSEISKDEAAAVTSITNEAGNSIFNNYEEGQYYTSFDEFKYFTGVTTIPSYAFKWSMTSITIPKSVTTIEDNAFNSGNLNSITLDEGNTSFVMESNVLYTADKSVIIRVINPATAAAFDIPSTVTKIGGGAFLSCYNIPSVTIPSSVTTIGAAAFEDCYNIETIDIPTSVTEIGEYALAWTGLKSVTIPSSVTALRSGLLAGCSQLTSLNIPKSITLIESDVIWYCEKLTDIELPETDAAITLEKYALMIREDADNPVIATIHVPLALLDDYALNPSLQQNFEAGKVVAKLTPANNYFTFSSGVDVVLPKDVDAYTCSIVSDSQVGITKLTDTDLLVDGQRVIKANNGLLLLGAAGTTYEIVAVKGTKVTKDEIVTTDAKSYGEDNQLEPVIESARFDAAKYYVLYNNKFSALDPSSAALVPACKAVLRKPDGISATRSLTIDDGETTGINKVVNDAENDTWYNLQGTRIETPTKKGLYIKNGKKVIIK